MLIPPVYDQDDNYKIDHNDCLREDRRPIIITRHIIVHSKSSCPSRCAKSLQLCASLALIVSAKHQIHDLGLCYDLFGDPRVVLHPKLCRTSLPFALTLVEHPEIREELKIR